MNKILSIITYLVSCALLLAPLYAITPHTINIDGNLSDWHEDELIYDDSQNDSPWGTSNEIHRLWATWDAAAFYLAVSGVQKDGNNLIVYIDTSPLGGIIDASVLKDPNDSNVLWWWRRGNRFGDGFRPDFQWHSYEMRLNVNDGHGLFRLYPDGKTANLNNLVEQRSSGGGSGVLSFMEIKIPWQVLFGGSGFPAGEELRIAACVTGGMDTRGTTDTSDDIFGSARDVIPDQKNDFPTVWYDTYTITNYLIIKISELAGRSPLPRALKIYQMDSDSVKLEWRPRGVIEKNLAEYRIYYSSSGNPLTGCVYKSAASSYSYISGLVPSVTYQFCLKALYNIGAGQQWEGGASETVSVYMNRPALTHTPQKIFCFPGKEMIFSVNSSRPILSANMRYLFGGDLHYNSIPMDVSGNAASVSLSLPSNLKSPRDIFYFFEITDSFGTYLLPPLLQSDAGGNLYSTRLAESSPQFVFPSLSGIKANFGGGVALDIPPLALSFATTIYFEYSTPLGENSIYCDGGTFSALAYYDFYSLASDGSRRGIVFEKPVKVTLKYFDADVSGVDESSLLVGRLLDDKNNSFVRIAPLAINYDTNTVSFETEHFSKFVLLKTISAPSSPAKGILKKIVRPVFKPSSGEVVEFVYSDSAIGEKRLDIFDLKSRNLRSIPGGTFWDGRDSNGDIVAPGVYLWRLELSGEKLYGACVVIR